MTQASDLDKTITFLRSIGFHLIETTDADGFVPAVRIDRGTLRFSDNASPSNLLHEAGHLAVLPTRYRAEANDDLDVVFAAMHEEMSVQMESNPDFECDSPAVRATMQAGETEATAWSFAAGRAIGLPDDITIRDVDYDGAGADVRLGLSLNCYFGINGLVAGGMCQSVKSFPSLTRWLQD